MAEQLLLAADAEETERHVSAYRRDEGFLLESIAPWAGNPRKRFDLIELQQLADSINAVGVEQPIGVRFLPGANAADTKHFQIVFGERRYRAAQIAGLTRIPALYLGELTDFEALERAYRENHDRENISPIEEARTYEQMLAEPPGMTQQALAEKLRIGQGTLSNALRLLRLPETIIDRVDHGQITKSAATALCGVLEHPVKFDELVLGIDGGWSSGRIEEEVRQFKASLAEQKRQTEVAASPQLPFEEPSAAAEPNASATPVVTDAPADVPAEPIPASTLEDEDVGESDLTDEDTDEDVDAPAGGEDDDTTTSLIVPVHSDDESVPAATVPPTATPAAAPAPSRPAPAPATPAPAPASKPATATAPTNAAATPEPASPSIVEAIAGARIAAMVLQADDDWMFEQGLDTIDQVFDGYRQMQETALSPFMRVCLKAVNSRYNNDHADAPISLSRQLSLVLLQAAQEVGYDVETLKTLPE